MGLGLGMTATRQAAPASPGGGLRARGVSEGFGGKAPGKKAVALCLREARTLTVGVFRTSWAPLQEMVIKDAEMRPGPVSPFSGFPVGSQEPAMEKWTPRTWAEETAGQGSCGNRPPAPSLTGRGPWRGPCAPYHPEAEGRSTGTQLTPLTPHDRVPGAQTRAALRNRCWTGPGQKGKGV